MANKVLLIEGENKTPGVYGWLTFYNSRKKEPIAIFDATALTGIRTAAKSLLVAQLLFIREKPKNIFIYGSSTQAFYHYNQFSKFYPNSFFSIIVKSKESARRIHAMLPSDKGNYKIKKNQLNIKEEPDIIITATSSKHPIVTSATLRSTKLIIAIGSSSGEHTEVDLNIVAASKIIVDADISVAGKGELNLAIKQKLISRKRITELHTLLTSYKDIYLNNTTPVLFVSKGLSIEDYIFA